MSVQIITAFLCDRVENGVSGKLNAYGIGITSFNPPSYPSAPLPLVIVMLIDADASEIGTKHKIDLELQDADARVETVITLAFDINDKKRGTVLQPMAIETKKPGLKRFVVKVDGKRNGMEFPLEFRPSKV